MKNIFAIGEKINGQTIVLVTDKELNKAELIVDGEKSSYEELDKLYPDEDKNYYSYLKEAWLFKLQTNLKDKVDIKYIEAEFSSPNCYIYEEYARYNHNNSMNNGPYLEDKPFTIFINNYGVDFKYDDDIVVAKIYDANKKIDSEDIFIAVDNIDLFTPYNVLNNFICSLEKNKNVPLYKEFEEMKDSLIKHKSNHFYDLYIENNEGYVLTYSK